MKKLLLAACLCILMGLSASAQKIIDTTTLANEKKIVVFSDKTWKYLNEVSNSQVTVTTERNMEIISDPSSNKSTNGIYTPAATKNHVKSTTPSTGSHQCHAITKKGSQCSRMVSNGYNCYQHGG